MLSMELHESASLEEAAGLMVRYGPSARFLAGGTDVLVDLKSRRLEAAHLISLSRIPGLQGISADAEGLRIGALTTIAQLDAAPMVRAQYAPILDATREMASPQVRNLATVGGNLASAVPCADLPPILTVLKARVTCWSVDGARETPLATFFAGPRRTVMQTGEVLVSIRVPPIPAGYGAAYARFALRDGNAIAVASVAAGLGLGRDGMITDARIVLGAVAPTPVSVGEAATVLVGSRATDAAFNRVADAAMRAAAPISDIRGSADYRRHLVGVLTRRALTIASRRAREGSR